MPKLTITLSQKRFQQIKKRASIDGFKNPNDWARFVVERNTILEESPRMSPTRIIKEMQKTKRYHATFLRELKKSLEYADKTIE